MRKLLLIGAITPLTFFGTVNAVKNDKPPKEEKKITICHATSSETNPWVRIVVSENAYKGHFENPGTPLAGHEDDVLLQGDVPCPLREVAPTPPPPSPTPNPTPNPTTNPDPSPTAKPAPVEEPTPTYIGVK